MPSDNNWMPGLQDALDSQSKIRREEIAKFNRDNSPIAEDTDEDGNTVGAFFIGDQWHFGLKYKNGYHPFALIAIPAVVASAIQRDMRGLSP